MTNQTQPLTTSDLAGQDAGAPHDNPSQSSSSQAEAAHGSPPQAAMSTAPHDPLVAPPQPDAGEAVAAGAGEGGAWDDDRVDPPRTAPTRDGSGAPATATADPDDASAEMALLGTDESINFRSRWQTVQVGFVDEPRAAVEQADALVAEVMRNLARRFAEERSRLEAQWTSGAEVGTEELRLALQRYRSFFQRLLER